MSAGTTSIQRFSISAVADLLQLPLMRVSIGSPNLDPRRTAVKGIITLSNLLWIHHALLYWKEDARNHTGCVCKSARCVVYSVGWVWFGGCGWRPVARTEGENGS